MNDLPPDSHPLPLPDPEPTPAQAIPAESSVAPVASTKHRLRDRLWSLRALIAVALASVIVGGLGGAALAKSPRTATTGAAVLASSTAAAWDDERRPAQRPTAPRPAWDGPLESAAQLSRPA